jgi:tRNA-Thr(GGU) m(6)t(6)A37 methyltransferase TsaA
MSNDAPTLLPLRPIGVVRTPFLHKVEAPRQGVVADGVEGRIELFPEAGFEHAVEDLQTWERLWVLTWFDRAEHWRPKVQPPRSLRRRGVFATRSPHRPNPIGLTCVRLVRVEGLTIVVRDLDILDGTPVVDLKPYVPYADAFPEAGSGWLEAAADPGPQWPVHFAPDARARLDFLKAHDVDLEAPLTTTLMLGPEPRPYRRIRLTPEGACIAYRTWRAWFAVEGDTIVVHRIASGLSAADLKKGHSEAPVHEAFRARFPPDATRS